MILCDVCKKEIDAAASSYKKDVKWPTKSAELQWHFHGKCAELLLQWIEAEGFAKAAACRQTLASQNAGKKTKPAT